MKTSRKNKGHLIKGEETNKLEKYISLETPSHQGHHAQYPAEGTPKHRASASETNATKQTKQNTKQWKRTVSEDVGPGTTKLSAPMLSSRLTAQGHGQTTYLRRASTESTTKTRNKQTNERENERKKTNKQPKANKQGSKKQKQASCYRSPSAMAHI